MTEELTFPKSRLELARILKDNNNCILKTTKYFKEHFEIDSDNTKLLETLLLRIRDRFKKAKRSLDCLEGEWWHSNISMKPELKKNRVSDLLESSSDDGEVPIHSVSHRKHLDDLSLQQQRTRLSSPLECIKSLSVIENTTEISIAALSLQLLANEENNRQVATVAKEIIVSGGFCNLSNKHVPVDKALFLLDLLEVGRRKYTQLRQTLLPDNIHFPSYSKLANLRDVMISRSSITLYPNPAKLIGIHAPYCLQVQKTLERILSMVDRPTSEEFPLTFKIADGLDGSGCHTIYNQQTTNTFTKNFILFCFKPISIHTVTNRIVWQNKSPNSPFAQRPIFLCAATECEENIRSFMETMINPDIAMLQNGIPLENGVVNVDIIRSMFDKKMAAILSGAGGASCQMCTATHKDLKDRNLVLEGFPINRNITDAIELFSHIDDIESFFALSTNERFNSTHQPISEINIHPASPLHSYTGVFRWFNLLVYHLRIEKFTWSPTSPVIKESMKFLQTFIQEKTGLKVDQPNSSGGTTSTGNVARRAFSDETEYLECILSTVAIQYRPILSNIHTQLSAILRVFNSSHKVNTLELGKWCKDTYLVILDSFPWASLTPTLHKLLAHSEELIRESNSSYGLKAFSEEGTESCNKLVRKYGENLARKVSFETNNMDIFVRLTSQSDPTLVNYRRILTCERCGQSVHTTRSKRCSAMNNQKTSIQTLFTT